MKYFVFMTAFLFISCQQKPTQVTSQQPILTENSSVGGKEWVQSYLKRDPVILDVRSPFDFNLAHVPTAINVRWEDFSQRDPHSRGLLDTDSFGLARRLSLIGIDPDRPVLILGKALEGSAEEGRIAWTLQVLGVKNVYTMNYKSLRSLRVQDAPNPENKPYWKPKVDESLTVDFPLFKTMVLGNPPQAAYPSKARRAALGGVPAGMLIRMDEVHVFALSAEEAAKKLVVLDVRSAQQFALENLTQKKGVKVPVVNLSWKEFFNERGFVDPNAREKLKSRQITPDSVIYVISNHGVESGAVTYALRFLGYKQSANFAGGYEQWNVKK